MENFFKQLAREKPQRFSPNRIKKITLDFSLLMDCGSLDKIVYENHISLDWSELYNIAIGTAKGISYLHESCAKQIIHFDIKAANVLIDSNLCPKLADFGLALVCDVGVDHFTLNQFRGTRGYAAPEVWDSVGVGCMSDVYSFGMLLFEILGRRKIWRKSGANITEVWFPKQVWECFRDGRLDEFISNCQIHHEDRAKAKTMAVVAFCCAQHVPENRPSMSIVVKILEGEIQVPDPPNPFPYVVAKGGVLPTLWSPVSTEVSTSMQTTGAQTATTNSDISHVIAKGVERKASKRLAALRNKAKMEQGETEVNLEKAHSIKQERTKREYYGPPPNYEKRRNLYPLKLHSFYSAYTS